MNTQDNGGPAFPIHPDSPSGHIEALGGMTLRDYFAAKAMAALVMEPPWSEGGTASVHVWSEGFHGTDHLDRFAFAAYKMADSMLKERAK